MMHVSAMRVLVLQLLVQVHVTVNADEGGIVSVRVMLVIVTMRVFVRDRLVPVTVAMALGDVQPHRGDEAGRKRRADGRGILRAGRAPANDRL